MLKIIGFVFLFLILSLLLLIVFVMAFIKFSPVFGGKVSAAQKARYQKSPQFHQGKFANTDDYRTVYATPNFIDDSIHPKANRQPNVDIPFVKLSPTDLNHKTKQARFTWFGHSTFLVEIDGKNILIDPMFSRTPSPIQLIGRKRYSKGLPLTIDELPPIDAVLITHDHYDHLDYNSILKIKSTVKQFYTPLGLSAHLMAWGVAEEKIQELDWFEDAYLDNIRLTLTPTHHYSGRSLTDRFETLWGGWIIKGQYDNIYLSGDGGYGPHFQKIGTTYGPFDFAMIECGQYNRFWRQNHLFPEQTAQVALDVQAKLVMPIHWGAFTLAMHEWTNPIERLLKKAAEWSIPITTPKIGEQLVLGEGGLVPTSTWWRRES